MKPTKSILILLSLFLISNCGDKVREEITVRYDNGNKKLLVKYKGEGSNEVVVERITYSESGDTLILEKPLDKFKMVRKYYEYGWGEENFKDGEKDGKQTSYYDNGQIWNERNYKDGEVVDGKYISYYDNGQIWDERNYKDGKLDGKWILYHDNGQIHNEGNYKDGLKDGKWTDYWENGQISSVRNFKDGKLVE